MTRAGTEVRLRSGGGREPRAVAATVTARAGEVVLDTSAGQRVLRVGEDVETVVWSATEGGAGVAAFLGRDQQPVAVLDLADWTPPEVDLSDRSRGGLEDPVEWTGLQELAAAAGLPVVRRKVTAPVDVRPGSTRRSSAWWVSIAMYVSAVLWLLTSYVLAPLVGLPDLAPATLALTTACALVLAVEQLLRRRRGRHLPAGDEITPRPSVPTTRLFRRTARLVLTGPAGPAETLVVRDATRLQFRVDGPSSPLGVQKALVVTPPGADRPERLDLVDGLGRQVVRLPWDQWFGEDAGRLEAFRQRGIPVERTSGEGLGPVAGEILLRPRSERVYLQNFEPPGGLGVIRDGQLNVGVTIAPLAGVAWGYESRATLVLGLLNATFLWGPVLLRGLARVLDAPR
ncbi:hypothetical protein DQ244_02335 [Blastococcus sp. TBT05-19]|uniref:hypothetical protein n=1 Tax=Blastococcus sp. TBT05-19 TaxID=2250581 RepID=UPI000DEBEAD3|nr:hypothetical protein [Blastococcus sp. TBT05-19]RBY94209.1 hypothetical protein DQ244_02335 [Blastococcus sp. TBT05-19]